MLNCRAAQKDRNRSNPHGGRAKDRPIAPFLAQADRAIAGHVLDHALAKFRAEKGDSAQIALECMRECILETIAIRLVEKGHELGAVPIVQARLRARNDLPHLCAGQGTDVPLHALGYVKGIGSRKDRRKLLTGHRSGLPASGGTPRSAGALLG